MRPFYRSSWWRSSGMRVTRALCGGDECVGQMRAHASVCNRMLLLGAESMVSSHRIRRRSGKRAPRARARLWLVEGGEQVHLHPAPPAVVDYM